MLAALLQSLGFELVATAGTARALRRIGIPVETVRKVIEGSPNVVDLVARRRHPARHQHARRAGDARRRLRDPGGGDRPPRPLHHHHGRGVGRRPVDRTGAGGRAGGAAGSALLRGHRCRPRRRVACRSPRSRRSAPTRSCGCATTAATRASPGQFFMLRAEPAPAGAYLPRAVSAAWAGDGEIAFLLDVRGEGTRALAARPRRSSVLGPLGQGFRPAAGDAILVGGGIGAAILPWLRRRLAPRGRVQHRARLPHPRPRGVRRRWSIPTRRSRSSRCW